MNLLAGLPHIFVQNHYLSVVDMVVCYAGVVILLACAVAVRRRRLPGSFAEAKQETIGQNCAGFLIVLVVIGAGAVEWANVAWDAQGPVARAGGETVVLIPAHSRTHDVARLLEDKGVVKYALLFEFNARLNHVLIRGLCLKWMGILTSRAIRHELKSAAER